MNNNNYAVTCTTTTATPQITNCCFWNNTPGIYSSCTNSWLGVNVTVNNNGDSCDAYYNIQMDPLFVNPANGDFHIQQNSPCIDAGYNNSVTIQTDFDGNIRIWDGNNDSIPIIDIGVYEYGSSIYTNITGNTFLHDYFHIFPNPANNYFSLVLTENNSAAELRIFNILGEEKYFSAIKKQKTDIDISGFTKGVYIIEVNSGNKISRQKIIKQ